MASQRISKSAIDWAKFASLIPKHDKNNFATFKAKHDEYMVRVMSNPEKAPDVDWDYYKKNIVNKDVVAKLEAAYKAVKVPYPPDTKSSEIDDQAKRAKAEFKILCEISNEKIKETEKLLNKFKVMIPYYEMTQEDFALTFPDWVISRAHPSVPPHPERYPGVSKEEREQLAKPDGYPWSIP